MKCLAFSLMLVFLAGTIARGQEPGQVNLFDRVSLLRLELERLDDSMGKLVKQRDMLASRLNLLAVKINEHKAGRRDGALLPDFSLDDMLRKSQEVSDSLTLINKEIEALRSARRGRLQRLGRLYGQLVDQTAERIRTARGASQKDLVKLLARVRHERDRVRSELGVVPASQSPMNTRNLLASEDPDELSERADAVSDEQDRLRRRLASLDRRIAEIRADRRLERDMRDFVEDHTLFGEESRILQLSKPSTETGSDTDQSAEEGGRQDFSDGPPVDTNEYDPSDGAIGGGSFPGAGDSSVAVDGTATDVMREGQVPVNLDESDSELGRLNPEGKLRVLETRRGRMAEQIKKLQILHDQLREKAENLIGK